MANEIRVTGAMVFAKDSARADLSGTINLDGDLYIKAIQVVGTSEEELALDEIDTIYAVAIRNLDETNFVEVGAATGEYCIKVPAGKYQPPVLWNGNGVFAKANTAPVAVEYLIVGINA